ncbi:MAG: class I SAM-dependent methyltransferase [Solirubrobacterales bacterium]
MNLSLRRGPDAISPTAHYTGETWVRNRLSPSGLGTWQGRLFFDALRPTMAMSRALGGPTLEGLLIARHRIIDRELERAIEAGAVGQVIEPACGMSPRGWRFAGRYGDRLTYVEADLPAMASRKREALARIGSLSERHRVLEVDVLREEGEGSLDAIATTLDPAVGTAIVTEGLLVYLADADLRGAWRRCAAALRRFPNGLYLADLRLGGSGRDPAEEAFNRALSLFVRGCVHRHFRDEDDAAARLVEAGFDDARLHRGDRHPAAAAVRDDPGAALIGVIEGTIG